MALVLNTNSYVEVDAAEEYFETRIDSANWFSSSDELKEQALVTATQLIDNQSWIGSAVSPSQALAWPRKSANYNDARLGMNITVPENVIPEAVKTAVYEQALHLLNNEDLLTGGIQTFENISIGSISLSDSNNDVTKKEVTPAIIKKLIRPLLARGATHGWWRAN